MSQQDLLKRFTSTLLAVCLVVTLCWPTVRAQHDSSDPELWKVVKPLDTIVSFMNTGAHPDDERSALLAYMSLGKGVRTSSVIANRGEGGQNEIGHELGNGLGIVRTRELEEASKVTNVDLFLLSRTLNDKIYDFGFSKSPEETLEKWGEEVTYERLIRIIREQRPDILFPSFRDVPSQHGHHRAISRLTVRAFRDAADPTVFPQHFEEGLEPWQPQKLYLPGTDDEESLRFNIGVVDPVYKKTYPQLGEDSRYLHKSQGMGRDLPVEDYFVSLYLQDSVVGFGHEETIFDNLPYDFVEYGEQIESEDWKEKLVELQSRLDEVIDAYPDKEDVLQKSQAALGDVRQLIAEADEDTDSLPQAQRVDLTSRLKVKEEQLQKVSVKSSGVEVALTATNGQLTRGTTADVTLTIQNRGSETLSNVQIEPIVPSGWDVSDPPSLSSISPGETATAPMTVTVDPESEYFHPYQPPVVQANVRYTLKGAPIEQNIHPDDTIAVLPDFGLNITPEGAVFSTEKKGQKIAVDVHVTNYVDGPNEGRVELDVPDGWEVQPQSAQVSFAAQGESEKRSFVVYPTDDSSAGHYTLKAVVHHADGEFSTQVQPIDYDHIGSSYWLKDSEFNVAAFPLQTKDRLKVGYVDSGFDQVGQALRQAGVDVEFLDRDDLTSGDLSQYDTIVVGIRAYLSREDLLEHNDRLLEYVRYGGNVVMQYHTPASNWSQDLPPYPIQLGTPSISWRVTDETAPVTILEPEHPLFQGPNTITADDFNGWVQERGLYFPSSWDDAYTPLLSMSDPGEEPMDGGLLVADYGAGSYIFSSLVWYRQIQSLVPGGYRMFVNLISYSRDLSSADMQEVVQRLNEAGELDRDRAVRSLKIHLTAVERFEQRDAAEKVVTHMNRFKQLLDHQFENAWMTEKAYHILTKNADRVLEQWQ